MFVVVDLGFSSLYLRQGRSKDALPILERAYTLSQAKNVYLYTPVLGSALGLTRCQADSRADGILLLEESARAAQKARTSQKLHQFASQVFANLSEGLLLADRARDALEAATRALELARASKERGNEAWALLLAGEVNSHPELVHGGTAEAYYQQALEIAAGLGMRPLVARCH